MLSDVISHEYESANQVLEGSAINAHIITRIPLGIDGAKVEIYAGATSDKAVEKFYHSVVLKELEHFFSSVVEFGHKMIADGLFQEDIAADVTYHITYGCNLSQSEYDAVRDIVEELTEQKDFTNLIARLPKRAAVSMYIRFFEDNFGIEFHTITL